jgi:hypothetical protein
VSIRDAGFEPVVVDYRPGTPFPVCVLVPRRTR